MNPKYPVYIISKGRWKNPQTAKALNEIGVDYNIVIEPQELSKYKKTINNEKIQVLPFSNLGNGSIPARNWVWEHSIKMGFNRHWILDDNISGFCRYNKNMRIPVSSGTIFRCAEDFTDRYKNIALSGFQYRCFGTNCRVRPPFLVNTRIYSCILIDNNLPFRWRGKYNEDTDLSLRCLKKGYCTVLFMAYMINKSGTMTMKGGNTDVLYAGDGRKKMADSLIEQHADVVTSTDKKYNRVQHLVNYKPFKKNILKFRDNYVPKYGVNNYGMILNQKLNNK